MLTNRETATLILIGALFVWALTKSDVRKSFGGVVRAFFHRSIVIVVLLYLTYSGLVVWLAFLVGAWNTELLKDTILVALTIGFPMVFNATSAKDGGSLARKTVLEVLGLSAILIFYINLASLSILGELIVQMVASLAVMLSVVAKHQGGKSLVVARFMDGLLVLIGLFLLVMTTIGLVNDWPSQGELVGIGLTFAMSIWLPLALLPFIYVLAFYAACESLFVALSFFNDRKEPHWKVRFAILIGFRGSVRFASNFTGRWRHDVAQLTSYRAARRVMAEYRASVRAEADKKKLAFNRLRDNAGVDGVDERGRRLDQREFEGTKKFLDQLATFQMGQHRNRLLHYNPDLLTVMGRGGQFGLPDEHGVAMVVARDKQRWYAWRRTVTGWVLGVGGSKDIDLEWRFEGAEPPSSFPSVKNSEWATTAELEKLPDWSNEVHG